VWRLSDGALLADLAAPVRGVRFTPDGARVVTWEVSGEIRSWDASSGALLSTVHTKKISAAAFTPDVTKIVTLCPDDGSAHVVELPTGTESAVFPIVHPAAAETQLLVRPDGAVLFSAVVLGQTVEVWDLRTGTRLRSIDSGVPITGFSETRDGARLVTHGIDGVARVWDAGSGNLVASFAGHADVITRSDSIADGTRLVTTSLDGTAKIWDLASGTQRASLPTGGAVFSARFSPDGRRIATWSVDGTLTMWSAVTGARLGSAEAPVDLAEGNARDGSEDVLRFSPDGQRLISVGETIQIWRGLGGALVTPPDTIDVSPDGARLLEERPDGTLMLSDASSGRPLEHAWIREPHVFSRDGLRLVAVGESGVVVLDARDGRTIANLPVSSPPRFEIDRAGDRLLIPGSPPRVWDVDREALLLTLDGRGAATISNDGGRVLAWTEPDKPEIWDVALGRPTVEPELALGFSTLGFSGDGTRLVLREVVDTKNSPSSVKIWDTTTGARLVTIPNVQYAQMDCGGSFVATSGSDSYVRLWRVSDGALLSSFVSDGGHGFFLFGGPSPDGSLVVANDLIGTSVDVYARDGRLLTRWSARENRTISNGRFQMSTRPSAFTIDGSKIIAWPGVILDARLEDRSPSEIARIVKERVRWRVVGGKLAPVGGKLAPVQARLRGRVTRLGVPVAGAEVTADQYHAFSGPDGTYEIDAPPGSYALMAASDTVGAFVKPRTVALDEGETSMDLELDMAATISGTVVDEAGHPLAGVTVVYSIKDDLGFGTSASDGKFQARSMSGGGVYTAKAFLHWRTDQEEELKPANGAFPSVTLGDGTSEVDGIQLVVRSR
jgi:WD40 repeat protein